MSKKARKQAATEATQAATEATQAATQAATPQVTLASRLVAGIVKALTPSVKSKTESRKTRLQAAKRALRGVFAELVANNPENLEEVATSLSAWIEGNGGDLSEELIGFVEAGLPKSKNRSEGESHPIEGEPLEVFMAHLKGQIAASGGSLVLRRERDLLGACGVKTRAEGLDKFGLALHSLASYFQYEYARPKKFAALLVKYGVQVETAPNPDKPRSKIATLTLAK